MRLLSYISLALALLASAEWWSSYRGQRSAGLDLPGRNIARLLTGEGRVRLLWGLDTYNPPRSRIQFHHRRLGRGGLLHPRTFWQKIGFHRSVSDNFTSVTVPHWLLVSLSALPPVTVWLYGRARRRKRRRLGLCLRCGYDVRNIPEKCPECGAAVESKGAPAAAGAGGG